MAHATGGDAEDRSERPRARALRRPSEDEAPTPASAPKASPEGGRWELGEPIPSTWLGLREAVEVEGSEPPRRGLWVPKAVHDQFKNPRWRFEYPPIEGVAAVIDETDDAIVFEMPKGDRVDLLVRGFGWLDEAMARPVLAGLCAVMARYHARGSAHGELHRVSIWIDGARSTILPPSFATHRSDLPAKSDFFAPEIVGGTATRSPQIDVWALGLLGFELLTGKPFWSALENPESTMIALLKEIFVDPIPLASERANELNAPELPEWFDAWFARCVARDADHRYDHAQQAHDAIGRPEGLPQAPIPPPFDSVRLGGAIMPVHVEDLDVGPLTPPVDVEPLANPVDAPEETQEPPDETHERRLISIPLLAAVCLAVLVAIFFVARAFVH